MINKLGILLAILVIASLALAACGTSATSTTPPATVVQTTAPATKPAVTTTAPVATSQPTSVAVTTVPPVIPSTKPVTTIAGPQQYGGILRIIVGSSPLVLGDPTLMTDSNSNMGMIPCLQALIFSDNAGKMLPVLATDWTVATDNKSITFNLRKGVKFHDGTDFNAQAAKWNLDRMKATNRGEVTQWDSIEATGDYSIRLNLKSFQNTILNGMEGTAAVMVSPTAAQKNGLDWIKLNPVGTGPYKFKSFSRDVSLEYTRFDDYWGGKPFLDGIKFIYIADGTTAQLAFQSGVSDVVSTMTDSVTADLIKRGYIMEKRPGAMMNLIPDSKHTTSPFADLKVRQAISYAIDRQGLANTLGYGLWEVVNQPAIASHFGHIDNSPYTYDVAKAKQLMKESGYPNGIKASIISSGSFVRDPLVVIQAQLAAIGIAAELKVVEFAAWNDYVSKGWDNALLWVTQGATDTNYVAFLDRYYGAKATRYPVMQKSKELTDLIDKALATPDYATEKSLCQQAVKMIVDDATAIPVYTQSAAYVLTDKVRDTYFNNLGGSGFRWAAEKAWLSK
jgi:peptide/nickel transport system substrate-binding protein